MFRQWEKGNKTSAPYQLILGEQFLEEAMKLNKYVINRGKSTCFKRWYISRDRFVQDCSMEFIEYIWRMESWWIYMKKYYVMTYIFDTKCNGIKGATFQVKTTK